jgi:putative heme-binding domain-containing protein
LSDVIKRFPRESLDRANRLLDRLKQHHGQQQLRLESLRNRLVEGDPTRGQQVFAGEKAKCSSCHRVGKVGKAVGPDLTTIGSVRSANDLLESIVFPSASIVRDYGTHQILTIDGRALTGLVVSESADAIQLQQASGDRVKVKHDDIEQITTGKLSIMPAGLDEALTEKELLDVVRYLQSLN